MLKTMTFAEAARWCGYPYSLVSIALTGRIVLPDSEIDVEVDGLDPELVRSMPGRFERRLSQEPFRCTDR